MLNKKEFNENELKFKPNSCMIINGASNSGKTMIVKKILECKNHVVQRASEINFICLWSISSTNL